MKDVVVQDLTEAMKMLKMCRIWCMLIDVQVRASELWLCN